MLDEENPVITDEEIVTEEPVNDEPITEEPVNNETNTIITIAELKKRLRLAGVDFSNYNDEDLQALIDLTLETIEAETGLPILNPRLITEYTDLFHNKVYETDYYPLTCCEPRVDGTLVEAHRIDMHLGIIYFRPGVTGDLEVKYQIQYTDATVLSPLITNMIALTIEGDTVHGTWNSIREGEVSVTYGAGSGGLQEKTDKTLAELKGYYKPRVRLL